MNKIICFSNKIITIAIKTNQEWNTVAKKDETVAIKKQQKD
jgi:HKD family nuclease